MDKLTKMSKRDFMKTALGIGGAAAAAKLIASAGSVKEAHAQLLESGISPHSVLAKIKKEGKLKIGYAQATPWFMRDPKANKLTGIYYDVCEKLAKIIDVKTEYQEIAWGQATVGLRKGDFDVFGSTLFYTMARSLVVNYVGPMWSKGRLALTHKDFAHRFKSAADFNSPDVIFSETTGGGDEEFIRQKWPKAKVITTSGTMFLASEPVRTKKAHLWMVGEFAVKIYARKNKEWAHIVDEEHSLGKNANTWAIRYGDPDWKFFLDMWADHVVTSGYMQERVDFYLQKLIKEA